MAGDSACSTSSTSSPGNVWRSESSTRATSSTSCRTCSSCGVCLAMFVPTTARSSSPKPCGNGSSLSGPRPPSSSRAVRGRTAIARASTRSFVMNCSTARSSIASPKPGSSSRHGAATTTPSDRTRRWDTSHRAGRDHMAVGSSRIDTILRSHNGNETDRALRPKPDHLMGSGQRQIRLLRLCLSGNDSGSSERRRSSPISL